MTSATSSSSAAASAQRGSNSELVQQRGTVLTYGTFDLFHVGHLDLLERLKQLGDRLVVGVSTDDFNQRKGKRTIIPFAQRARIVLALDCVNEVIAEESWEQKRDDIKRHEVSVFGIGADWNGEFDYLQDLCRVTYLARTDGISTTELKKTLSLLDEAHVNDLRKALDIISTIVSRLD